MPIPQISEFKQKPFEILVDFILFCKENIKIDSTLEQISWWLIEIIDIAVLGFYFEDEMNKQECFITDCLDKFFYKDLNEFETEVEKKDYILNIYQNYKDQTFFTKAFINYKQIPVVKTILGLKNDSNS